MGPPGCHDARRALGTPLPTDLPAGAGAAQDVGPGHQVVPKAAATSRAADAAVAAGDGHAGGGARGHGAEAGVLRARLVGRLTAAAAHHRARAQVVLAGVPRVTAAALDGEERRKGP